MNEELFTAISRICSASPVKIILSNPKSPLQDVKKITVRKLAQGYQIERFTEKQAFQENCSEETLVRRLTDEMTEHFRQCNALCAGYDYELKLSKKGKLLQNRRTNRQTPRSAPPEHNRKKNYLLPEGSFVPALYELGIMTAEGKVVASRYDKFKQINRFVECIDHALRDDEKKTLEIVDFGCGKSYLTFVLYHYLTQIRQKKVRITGLDLKRDVIEACSRIAEQYGYDGLRFQCCDIRDYQPDTPPDMVITLHACDTATDYALYNALLWKSTYIFSVPCCQHELNASAQAHTLRFMTDYGLIKERLCALATDAMRGKLLEYQGYQVDMLEFVDMDNSPKNLLIRAKRGKMPNLYKKKALEEEFACFGQEFGTKLTLFRLLEHLES